MKRYRTLPSDFDFRANILKVKIEDSWTAQIKQTWEESKVVVFNGLLQQYGVVSAQAKLRNFSDLGEAPHSIYAFHNHFFHQVRNAFVMEAYYPALTGACALGERILNHLLLTLRDSYKSRPEYKHAFRKKSFDDWDIVITTLRDWEVLRPEVAVVFQELHVIRNKTIHFRPEIDHGDRDMAILAIQLLAQIISLQFGAFGDHPWFIPNTPGVSFLKKSAENNPFIKAIYIPRCVHVGPCHKLELSDNKWVVIDKNYPDRKITDAEFAALFSEKSAS